MEARLCPGSPSNQGHLPVCTSLLSDLGSSLPSLQLGSARKAVEVLVLGSLVAFEEPSPPLPHPPNLCSFLPDEPCLLNIRRAQVFSLLEPLPHMGHWSGFGPQPKPSKKPDA